MAEVKWIKLATEIFDNRKIRQIECLPDGDGIIVVWFKLLCLAGNINDNGMVYFTKDIPYTDQMLACQFNRPLPLIQMALKTFESFGMIEVVDSVLHVSNWEKYQSVDRLKELREYNRLAQQKSRERKRLLQSVNDKSMTSQSCQDTDIDKDKDIKNNIIYNDQSKTVRESDFISEFEQLWSIYPRKEGKKKAQSAYIRARKKGTTYEAVRQGIDDYNRHIKAKKTDKKYIKQGATWFNGECWNDELDFSRTNENGATNFTEREYKNGELDRLVARNIEEYDI